MAETMTPTYVAKLTITKMKPATKALFLRLWRDAVARCEAHAAEGCKPLTGERGATEHENLADYIARLVDYVEQGETPAFALATTRRPPLSPYTHTPTVEDLEALQ